jgi:hypothetical protein
VIDRDVGKAKRMEAKSHAKCPNGEKGGSLPNPNRASTKMCQPDTRRQKEVCAKTPARNTKLVATLTSSRSHGLALTALLSPLTGERKVSSSEKKNTPPKQTNAIPTTSIPLSFKTKPANEPIKTASKVGFN